MSKFHLQTLAACVLCFVARTGNADPILMAEFRVTLTELWQVPRIPPFNDPPTEFYARWASDLPPWERTFSELDVGELEIAPPDLTSQLAQNLANAPAQDLVLEAVIACLPMGACGPGSPSLYSLGPWETGSFGNSINTIFTPPDALPVVRWEWVLESFIQQQFDADRWTIGGVHTMRIYGQEIPEPMPWMLVLVCSACHFFVRPHRVPILPVHPTTRYWLRMSRYQ